MEKTVFNPGDFVKFDVPDAPKGLFQVVSRADYTAHWDSQRKVLVVEPFPETLYAIRSIDSHLLEGQIIPVRPEAIRRA